MPACSVCPRLRADSNIPFFRVPGSRVQQLPLRVQDTMAPMYLYRDYFKADVYYYMSTWTHRVLFEESVPKALFVVALVASRPSPYPLWYCRAPCWTAAVMRPWEVEEFKAIRLPRLFRGNSRAEHLSTPLRKSSFS